MKKVPFVANSEDGMHCVPAVYRMLHQYFFGTDLTWEEIDKIMRVVPGKGVWTTAGSLYLADKGVTIKDITPMDPIRLANEKEKYLEQFIGAETLAYYEKNSNFHEVLDLMTEYSQKIESEVRDATMDDVVKLHKDGWLLGIEINPRILNNRDGFSLHFVLVYGIEGDELVFHDPGLPPQEARRASLAEFEKSFLFEGANPSLSAFGKA